MPKQGIDLSFLTTPFEEIELPSKGAVYKADNTIYEDNSPKYTGNLKKGILHIRPWVATEEKSIDRIVAGNFYAGIKRLIEGATQENIKVETLTLGDAFYIIYMMRALTYGPRYKVNTTCPICGKNTVANLDIYSYPVTFFEGDIVKDIILPKSNIEVILRMPLFGDFIDSTEQKLSDMYTSGVKVTPNQYLIAKCIEKMILPNEAKQELTQENFGDIIDRILPKLEMLDIVCLLEELDKFNHGIIGAAPTRCKECDETFKIDALMDISFFRPSGARPADSN